MKCVAINCDEELSGSQRLYCSHRCKQAVKYAVKTGRQCRECYMPIAEPVPVMGGYADLCGATKCLNKEAGAA